MRVRFTQLAETQCDDSQETLFTLYKVGKLDLWAIWMYQWSGGGSAFYDDEEEARRDFETLQSVEDWAALREGFEEDEN